MATKPGLSSVTPATSHKGDAAKSADAETSDADKTNGDTPGDATGKAADVTAGQDATGGDTQSPAAPSPEGSTTDVSTQSGAAPVSDPATPSDTTPATAKAPDATPETAPADDAAKLAAKKAAEAAAAAAATKPRGVQPKPRKVGRQRKRKWATIFSFFLLVVVPTVLGGLYYGMVATDRYATGASFVVRKLEQSAAPDMLSSVTGFASSNSTTSDSYVIRNFLISPDLLRRLDEELDLREVYSAPDVDPLSRFNASRPFEDFVKYWPRRMKTSYDNTTGIVTFEVQAYDPETAVTLADTVLAATEQLVNALSEAARRDAVKFATSEVERAEEALRQVQADLREFRSVSGSIDLTTNARLDAELVAGLEERLTELKTRIAVLAQQVSPDAPSLKQMRTEASALEAELVARRAAVGGTNTSGDGSSTAEALANYEALQLEQTFAQQRFASALASLESARIDADRQQRYLAVFSRPALPEDAIYPLRVRDTFLIAISAFLIWAVGSLLVASVRDHMR
ncbi:hypothetical protein [uncultured Maritimibacter sp.]|jgi:capsular polysaccharide transport system permease protein|uniref:hypothetical protein n=1 Tax=uncultured Maritimibacter sp. TaxID=991866 RepID=UPI002635F8A7|nr:hypothetical protein [uncultured Maritimibacter sp.]